MKQRKLALSMRGGAVKCSAYWGFLRLLEEENIEISSIVASSGGAVVAGPYALGKSIAETLEYASKLTIKRLFDLQALKNLDLADPQKIENSIKDFLGDVQIENLPIKLWIQLTDYDNHIPVLMDKGSLAKVTVASTAFPFLSEPINIEGTLYGDGDLAGGYEANFLRSNGAEIVIGLECSSTIPENHNVLSVNLIEPLHIMRKTMLDLYNKQDPVDLRIENLDQNVAGLLDFSKVFELADAGYERSKLFMPKIHELLFSRKNYYFSALKRFFS